MNWQFLSQGFLSKKGTYSIAFKLIGADNDSVLLMQKIMRMQLQNGVDFMQILRLR